MHTKTEEVVYKILKILNIYFINEKKWQNTENNERGKDGQKRMKIRSQNLCIFNS
jgi:hypothetical protein